MRLSFLSVILCLAIVSSCKPQTKNFDFNRVDKILTNAIDNKAFPGTVVLVSKDEKI